MTMTVPRAFGLTTDDALAAYRSRRLDLLADSNRWKPFLLDHVAGLHSGGTERFERICLICGNDLLRTTGSIGPRP